MLLFDIKQVTILLLGYYKGFSSTSSVAFSYKISRKKCQRLNYIKHYF